MHFELLATSDGCVAVLKYYKKRTRFYQEFFRLPAVSDSDGLEKIGVREPVIGNSLEKSRSVFLIFRAVCPLLVERQLRCITGSQKYILKLCSVLNSNKFSSNQWVPKSSITWDNSRDVSKGLHLPIWQVFSMQSSAEKKLSD